MPLKKEIKPKQNKLNCSSTRKVLALNNPQRLIYHNRKKPKKEDLRFYSQWKVYSKAPSCHCIIPPLVLWGILLTNEFFLFLPISANSFNKVSRNQRKSWRLIKFQFLSFSSYSILRKHLPGQKRGKKKKSINGDLCQTKLRWRMRDKVRFRKAISQQRKLPVQRIQFSNWHRNINKHLHTYLLIHTRIYIHTHTHETFRHGNL